ncbi:Hypothetical predicted protein [Octopus vulgaris]|uniref:Uncharacterized protein n=1 Tax=Octopus vulgaris TaxID=6645 RepID=A0AA36FGE4_OCTVU|nr:Hypothetical predicted protein [Octopus vulgaris]
MSASKNICDISLQEFATRKDCVPNISKNIDNRKKIRKTSRSKFTMGELLRCLPKRTFFDCHANVLREKLNSEGHLENQRQNIFQAEEYKMKDLPKLQSNITSDVKGLPRGMNVDIKGEFLCDGLAKENENKEGNIENPGVNLELNGKIDRREKLKETAKTSAKKPKENEILNSHCLLEYLQYIRDNDQINPFMVRQNTVDDMRTKFGRCFESQHRPQTTEHRQSKVSRAALQLNLKWKPVCQSGLLSSSDAGHHRRHFELTRRIGMVYQWMEKVTTVQFMKERNKVLRMLGEEMHESRRNLSVSRYIRQSAEYGNTTK